MPYHEKIHRFRPLIEFLLPAAVTAILLTLPVALLLWRGVSSGFAGYLTESSVINAARLSVLTSEMSLLVTLLL